MRNNKYIYVFIPLMFFFIGGGIATAQQEMIDKISEGFVRGNVSFVSSYFNEKMELSVLGKNVGVYSKTQAQEIIQSFFSTNTPQSFNISHKGIKENSGFAIGILTTVSNKKYRVYILLRNTNEKSLIHQLRIDETND
ncbi:MAG: DUF4783 domain-containing protein [Paludibacteraceae bacterium]|nr:DUF4783 domain-containing protein [Paludibacteraceae bacterium]MBP6285157.1 DUF4783 domain-containing protein [Paludibacteraceae bacterium]